MAVVTRSSAYGCTMLQSSYVACQCSLLACMLTSVFSFVFMATGLQKCLSNDHAVIMLVCVQCALNWLNWFREIMLLMLQKGSMALHRVMITW